METPTYSHRASPHGARRRLFFGLRLSTHGRQAVVGRLQCQSLTGRPVPVANFHVTLVFLGSLTAEEQLRAECAADTVASPAACLTLDRLVYWRGPRIEALLAGGAPTPALQSLQRSLVSALEDHALAVEKRPWRPHVTVSRKAAERTETPIRPLRMCFRHFHLFESRSTADGVIYVPLREWSLGRRSGV